MANKRSQYNSFGLDTREDIIVNAIEIFDTVKQALIVLDQDLRVVLANASFYKTFHVTRDITEGQKIYDIGNGQWNIESLRELLEEIIPQGKEVENFEVTHDFEHIGPKVMMLNAREIVRQDNRKKVILLAIDDMTYQKWLQFETKEAETKINAILERLVGSSVRMTSGLAPQVPRGANPPEASGPGTSGN